MVKLLQIAQTHHSASNESIPLNFEQKSVALSRTQNGPSYPNPQDLETYHTSLLKERTLPQLSERGRRRHREIDPLARDAELVLELLSQGRGDSDGARARYLRSDAKDRTSAQAIGELELPTLDTDGSLYREQSLHCDRHGIWEVRQHHFVRPGSLLSTPRFQGNAPSPQNRSNLNPPPPLKKTSHKPTSKVAPV